MTSELAPSGKGLSKRVSLALAARATARMEQVLFSGVDDRPSMVAALEAMFFDDRVLEDERFDKEGNVTSVTRKPRVSVKEKTNIAALFMRQTLSRERMMRHLGLKFNEEAPVKTILAHVEKTMSPEEQRKFLLDAVHEAGK